MDSKLSGLVIKIQVYSHISHFALVYSTITNYCTLYLLQILVQFVSAILLPSFLILISIQYNRFDYIFDLIWTRSASNLIVQVIAPEVTCRQHSRSGDVASC